MAEISWLEVTVKLRYPADRSAYVSADMPEPTLEDMAKIDQEGFNDDYPLVLELIADFDPDAINVIVSPEQDD